MTPLEYRKRHKKCRYCSWLELVLTRRRLYYKCLAKDKTVCHLGLWRPWCPCYETKGTEEK